MGGEDLNNRMERYSEDPRNRLLPDQYAGPGRDLNNGLSVQFSGHFFEYRLLKKFMIFMKRRNKRVLNFYLSFTSYKS